MEPMLTLDQIAERLQVHIVTVRRWVRSGKIAAHMASRQAGYRVTREDLEAFIARTRAVQALPEQTPISFRTGHHPDHAGADNGRPEARGEPSMVHRADQLIQSWLDGDEDEQRHTLEFLERALDEDRLSERHRFGE